MNSMGDMLFLNRHYKLLEEVQFPVHNPSMDSEFTTLYIFDISDEKAIYLCDAFDDYVLECMVREDLNIWDDNNPVPGKPYHRFRVEMPEANIIYLYDTMAYNV